MVDIGQVPLVSTEAIIHFDLLGQLVARRLSHLSGYDGDYKKARMHFVSQAVALDREHADAIGLHPCPYRYIASSLPSAV